MKLGPMRMFTKKMAKFTNYSHKFFYDNKSNGSVIGYWSPHYGQINNGEYLYPEQAVNAFSWMLDLISETTSKKPFIDQLNFTDNTADTLKMQRFTMIKP